MLAKMKKVTPQTRLFLRDFRKKIVYGPMRAVGEADLDIDRAAWKGRFPAQIRFETPRAPSPTDPDGCASVSYAMTLNSGELTPAKTNELLRALGTR